MLTPAQLVALQGAMRLTLDLTCTLIQRAAPSPSAWATDEPVWTTVAGPVAAGMSEPTRQQLALYGGVIGAQRAWVVSLPYGTPVARGDQLSIAGRVLRVQADLSLGSYSTLTQVLATEVQ